MTTTPKPTEIQLLSPLSEPEPQNVDFDTPKGQVTKVTRIPSTSFILVLPGGTVGYPAHPRLIRCPSVISLLSFLRKIAQAQQIW